MVKRESCLRTILLMPELTLHNFSCKRAHLYLKRNIWSSSAWDSLLWWMALLPVNRSSSPIHLSRFLERMRSTTELLTFHSCSTLPVSSFPRWFSNNATSTFWYSNLFSFFIESVRHLCGFPTKKVKIILLHTWIEVLQVTDLLTALTTVWN